MVGMEQGNLTSEAEKKEMGLQVSKCPTGPGTVKAFCSGLQQQHVGRYRWPAAFRTLQAIVQLTYGPRHSRATLTRAGYLISPLADWR